MCESHTYAPHQKEAMILSTNRVQWDKSPASL